MPRHAWQKGQSGNLAGRPKAIAGSAARLSRMIDEATDGGKVIVDELMKVFRKEAFTSQSSALKLRIAEILFERLAGRPQVEVTIEGAIGVAPLSLAQLGPRELDAIELALAPVVATQILDAESSEHALPEPDPSRAE